MIRYTYSAIHLFLEQWFSTRDNFAQQGTLAMSGDVLVVTTWDEGFATAIQWVEAGAGGKHPAIHRTDPSRRTIEPKCQ